MHITAGAQGHLHCSMRTKLFDDSMQTPATALVYRCTDIGTSSALLNVATVNDDIADYTVLGMNDDDLIVRAGKLAPA